jgi:flagellar basal-body rod protein FlgB
MSMTNGGMINTMMIDALGRFLDVDVARYKLIATNLANIDTPRYRTRDLNFHAELQRDAAESSPAAASGELPEAAFSPVSFAVSGLIERPDGNNVSIERESLLMAETQMKYNLAAQLLKEQFHLISTAINSGGSTS